VRDKEYKNTASSGWTAGEMHLTKPRMICRLFLEVTTMRSARPIVVDSSVKMVFLYGHQSSGEQEARTFFRQRGVAMMSHGYTTNRWAAWLFRHTVGKVMIEDLNFGEDNILVMMRGSNLSCEALMAWANPTERDLSLAYQTLLVHQQDTRMEASL
jgi:hypothetical protein